MCLCRPYVCLINYEHVPVVLLTIVVFRANYQYISLDSMEKFLSYASNGISFSIGDACHLTSYDFHIPIKFLSYEPKEASAGVTIVASSTAGTVVFFKKRNSTKS